MTKGITTLSGQPLSLVGLGTFPLQGEAIANNVETAYSLGYNLIDTADDYRGETGIGIAVKRGTFKREDIFLQTKISNNTAYADEPLAGKFFNTYSRFMSRHSVDEVVREKVATSLRELDTDYLDSVLIHYPYPDYFNDIWQVLINLKKEGVIRYIGCSNFHIRHIKSIYQSSGIMPDINEIYISPIGTKEEDVDYAIKNGIQLMTYSPLMDISRNRIPVEYFSELEKKYNKSLAQIILRWNVDRGCIPLAKSNNSSRLAENISISDFFLSKEEVSYISLLNRDFQILPESRICPGI